MDIIRKAVACTSFSSGARDAISLAGPDLASLSGTVPTLLQAALEDAKATASDSLSKIDVAALEKELEECKAALASALAEEELAAKKKEEALHTKTEAQKLAKAAEAEAAALKRHQQASIKAWSKAREEHARALAVAEGPAKLLEEGGWSSEEVKLASLQALQKLVPQTKAEQDLCAAVGEAFGKKPDARARFDHVVVEATIKSINEYVQDLSEAVTANSMKERLAKAESYGLWAIASTESDRSGEAREAEAAASESLKRACKETESAKKRLKTVESTTQKLSNEKVALEEEQKIIEEARALLESKP